MYGQVRAGVARLQGETRYAEGRLHSANSLELAATIANIERTLASIYVKFEIGSADRRAIEGIDSVEVGEWIQTVDLDGWAHPGGGVVEVQGVGVHEEGGAHASSPDDDLRRGLQAQKAPGELRVVAVGNTFAHNRLDGQVERFAQGEGSLHTQDRIH